MFILPFRVAQIKSSVPCLLLNHIYDWYDNVVQLPLVLKFKNLFHPSKSASAEKIANSPELDNIVSDRNKLGLTLQTITEAVLATDTNRRLVFFNQSAANLLGLHSSFLGSPLNMIFKINQNLNPISETIYCPIQNQVEYTQTDLKITNLQTHLEKSVNIVARTNPQIQQLGLGCILTLHDASREKQLEQMKLDFVSMAAHELRTPITSIKGYLDVYMKENAGKITPEHMTLLNQIKSSTLHLYSLVDNLLNVTKIERGAFTVNLETVNLEEVVQQAVNELLFKAQSKYQILSFEKPLQVLPHIQADKLRIGEVVTNLVTNAINYSPPSSKIRVWIEQQGNELITHVQDSGPGIPKEEIPKLFQKFYRIHRQLEQKSNGTGLGLFISKAIVEMHKGRIWVESEENKGSTFSFSIPIATTTQLNFSVDEPVDINKILKQAT